MSQRNKAADKKKTKKTIKKKVDKLKRKATFIGIDLAWSERNQTGCAIIQNERLIAYAGDLGSNLDIVAFIGTYLDYECPAVIGIDAPLRVPNETGSRTCDKALSAEWRRYEAGALPANRQIFARMNTPAVEKPTAEDDDAPDAASLPVGGGEAHATEETFASSPIRGETLVALLTERLRFTESALIPHHTDDRLVCEIYPHPAHVSLFGLEKTLKYKARSKRTYDERWPEFERYQQYLRSLRWAEPKLKRTKALLTRTDVRSFRGKALKEYEDTLDAITCAYVVYYLWTHGPDHARTYGSLTKGHIIVPITEKMMLRLNPI